MKPNALNMAHAAWGAPLPDWVEALAAACVRTSQTKVAHQLERSTAIISQVLHKVYKADMAHIEVRVRGVFMGGCINCPGLGEIGVQVCQNWREKANKFEIGSPLRARMYRACNACPRHLKEGEQ